MENRIQHLLLTGIACFILLWPVNVLADDTGPVIEPDLDPKEFKVARIDNEFFEIGLSAGLISIEDFGTVPTYGAQLTFHATEDLFLQAIGGYANATVSTAELILGEDIRLLNDSERQYVYYDFLVGLNWLPGESFITRKLAFKSSNYIAGGVGNTLFGGENNLTWVGAIGYKLVLTDFMTWQYDIRDHIFESDLLGSSKWVHNIELSTGVSLFF